MSFYERPNCLLKGAEVSPAWGRSVFLRGAEVCLDEGPKRLFQKRPKCPIGAEVVVAEVVGAEVSKIPGKQWPGVRCSDMS